MRGIERTVAALSTFGWARRELTDPRLVSVKSREKPCGAFARGFPPIGFGSVQMSVDALLHISTTIQTAWIYTKIGGMDSNMPTYSLGVFGGVAEVCGSS